MSIDQTITSGMLNSLATVAACPQKGHARSGYDDKLYDAAAGQCLSSPNARLGITGRLFSSTVGPI